MATKKAQAESTVDESTVDVSAPDEWEFDTLVEESPTMIIFDEIGDVFVGQYVGVEHIDPDNGKDEPFDRFNFRARDGKLYGVNQSYQLVNAMEKVEPGQWIRITYAKDIPTKRGLNPMKDFKIDVRK
jgi:hypothetical protein